ncbi:MAG: DUF4258 domain-containing protein [bacterium]
MKKPLWWNWELEITSHIEKRMIQRGFTEIELRTMIQRAEKVIPDKSQNRWCIQTRHKSRMWEVIVEPDFDDMCIIVITAYPKG